MDFSTFLCLAFAFFIVVVVVLPNLVNSSSQWESGYREDEHPDSADNGRTLLGSLGTFVNDRPYGNNLSRSSIHSSSRRTDHRSESRRNTGTAFSWLLGDDSSNRRTSSTSRSSFGSSHSSGSSISTRGGFGSPRSSSRSSSFGKTRSSGGTRSSSSFSSRSSSGSRSRSSSPGSSSKPKTMKKSSSFKKK